MGISVGSETDTVVKKILPYLQRRGYAIEVDVDFEAPAKRAERLTNGYVDLLVTLGKSSPTFLIEAKRASKSLTGKDRDQALSYGVAHKVPFVVVTNGDQIQCFNTATKQPIAWDGTSNQKIPTKDQLKSVIAAFKKDKLISSVPLGTDRSLPFRPGLSPKQLNALFYKCHSDIRRIEKSEDRAFEDFSKILFLKLYEEKCDVEGHEPPYSWTFHEMAERRDHEADQVRNAIKEMIQTLVKEMGYGEVLGEPISLKNAKTYQSLVRRLAAVSFYDSSFDSKGAAFEYYVRATLKGKKLGQYFTPRPAIHLMSVLLGREKIAHGVLGGVVPRVVDPACGTGGFLVYLLKQSIEIVQQTSSAGKVFKGQLNAVVGTLKESVFYGADANDSVASAAKMNMIIAGDGQSNIHAEDTLKHGASVWSVNDPNCDIVISNPPFGTSEADSLTAKDLEQFPVKTNKGQLLFLQKMVLCARPDGGEICTVIDDGVLNTDSALELRTWLLQNCILKAVVQLPEVTFKPNKINVRSSILYLHRREHPDVDLESEYGVRFIELDELGYEGSGEPIRGFDEKRLMTQIEEAMHGSATEASGEHWRLFTISSQDISQDVSKRMDLRYWRPEVTKSIRQLTQGTQPTLGALATEEIVRGKSPPADSYVDEADGYALVIKSGTNISRFGEVIFRGDFIEKNQFEEDGVLQVKDGDVLLASTGTGTLGKCAVFRSDRHATADGHVTVIRVDPKLAYPEYVCDYLRLGFGAAQIERAYTGSTGLIELTPERVRAILIELPGSVAQQKKVSQEWRKIETKYRHALAEAEAEFEKSRSKFLSVSLGSIEHEVTVAEEG